MTFEVYPHRVAFERALLGTGYDPALARSASNTMVGIGGHRRGMLNGQRLSEMPWLDRVVLLAQQRLLISSSADPRFRR